MERSSISKSPCLRIPETAKQRHNRLMPHQPTLGANAKASGATSCPPNLPESSAQNPFKNPPQPHPGARRKRKISRHRRNDVSRQHTVPGGVSGSVTSFRMSHEIVPVCPAGMSHHIVPVGTSANRIAPETRKAMSRGIVPHLVRNGPERDARR